MTPERQKVWDTIRLMPNGLTITGIAMFAKVQRSTARSYMEALEAGGYISSDLKGRSKHFTLINDVGCKAPRVRRDGSEITPADDDKRIWDTMRRLKTFTAKDVQVTASLPKKPIALTRAQTCCEWWAKAGYLKISAGHSTGDRTYRFVLETGPNPPRMTKMVAITDQNRPGLRFEKEVGAYS